MSNLGHHIANMCNAVIVGTKELPCAGSSIFVPFSLNKKDRRFREEPHQQEKQDREDKLETEDQQPGSVFVHIGKVSSTTPYDTRGEPLSEADARVNADGAHAAKTRWGHLRKIGRSLCNQEPDAHTHDDLPCDQRTDCPCGDLNNCGYNGNECGTDEVPLATPSVRDKARRDVAHCLRSNGRS